MRRILRNLGLVASAAALIFGLTSCSPKQKPEEAQNYPLETLTETISEESGSTNEGYYGDPIPFGESWKLSISVDVKDVALTEDVIGRLESVKSMYPFIGFYHEIGDTVRSIIMRPIRMGEDPLEAKIFLNYAVTGDTSHFEGTHLEGHAKKIVEFYFNEN